MCFKITFTKFGNPISAQVAEKQLGGRAPKAVESRHARYMCRRETTLLDPTVGGGAAPLLQHFKLLISKGVWPTVENC